MQCRSFSSILWNFGKKLEKFGLMTKKIVLNSINKLPINKLVYNLVLARIILIIPNQFLFLNFISTRNPNKHKQPTHTFN